MRLNIARKIFGIALVVLVLMAAVAVYSIPLTANISDELDTVRGTGSTGFQTETQPESASLQAGLGAPPGALSRPNSVGVSTNVPFLFLTFLTFRDPHSRLSRRQE